LDLSRGGRDQGGKNDINIYTGKSPETFRIQREKVKN